ncbi:MAG: Gfo/Idh/MocA family oxidoreductase [Candidatus Hydrogenedens sp.]|jgi:predicted dehydrogenase|nr:Gfo/Idh/MocA family oxidoreductase [Candidatus Hydrogenedens sp.]
MKTAPLGIIMNGVTGRMGTNQHLMRSLMEIRKEGGLPAGDQCIIPEPLLVGRNEAKLKALSDQCGGLPWSTDLDAVLSDDQYQVYFDALSTVLRVEGTRKAIRAGKDVYLEKPIATTSEEALSLYHAAEEAGVKHGVVQDKLWLPGLLKLKHLIDTGFFGRILSVRGEFGYWVFEGDGVPMQRPSWNYKKAEGGGIILDMLCHWRYVIDNLFGNINSVTCLGEIHVRRRWDEAGNIFEVDTDDAAYATFVTEPGIVCQFNSSWATRVRRDDLLTLHVDGEKASAVAGLTQCQIQPAAATPRYVWNPDEGKTLEYASHWTLMPDTENYKNAFRAQWELFLKHVVLDTPFHWNLLEGAKGVQLAELGMESWQRRTWLDVPDLV